MDKLFIVSSPPHIHTRLNLKNAVWIVILCLIPSLIAGVVFFGFYALIIIFISIAVSVFSETIFEYLSKRKTTIQDGTAVLTGLLLGLSLPPNVPLWIPLIGACFSIIISKQIFGGTGFNLLNPALTGRAFLMLSFPQIMSVNFKYQAPETLSEIDAVTSATPLTLLKSPFYYKITEETLRKMSSFDFLKLLLFGHSGGSIGEACKILIIAGGIILLIFKVIDYRIIIGYILSFCLMSLMLPGRINPLFQLFTGGVLLAIFFMATDWVTSPVTKNGRWIFGIGCGFFTALFRLISHYPEGVTPAILLMNLFVPFFDKIAVIIRR
ncbi:MAG: RnfABCDGE type electron transport complex subunit D [candidate division WOR-3 bacterium]|nr:RnfABCDGE type electron transport complex subunit D [candidate division WOR-3 bacterium]